MPPARVPVPGNVAAYPGYVGTYASGTYALTGALQGDYLLVGASGERPDTLLALTDTTFFVPGDPGEYLFALGGGTTAAELLYRTNGQALRFRRRGG